MVTHASRTPPKAPESVASEQRGTLAGRFSGSVPLPVLMGSVVVACMLALAAILMWQGSQAARASLLSAAFVNAQDMAVIINEKTRRILSPAEAALRQLSLDPLGGFETLDERLARLPTLTQLLIHGELVSAVYIGYKNGDFLLVRALDDPALAHQFSPPVDAAFLVQSIDAATRQGITPDKAISYDTVPGTTETGYVATGEWLFYTANLTLLERRPMPAYHFDPRSRPWYQSAVTTGRQTLTTPYIFFTSLQIGVSLSQNSSNGQAVLGVDLALSDLGTELNDLQRTPNSEIALVDDQGRVLAYKDYARALVRNGDQLSFQTLAGLKVPALQALVDTAGKQNEPVLFAVGGENWFGVRMPLDSIPDKELQILLAVPDEDLLAAVRQTLETQSLWTLGLIGVLLPFGWLAGRQVGVSLSRITRQAQELTRFNFTGHRQSSSLVREVKELDVVFGNMCLTMQNFLRTTEVISSEPRLDVMLQGVLGKLVNTTHCKVGAVYLFSDSRSLDLAAVAYDSKDATARDDVIFPDHLPTDYAQTCPETPGRVVMPLKDRQHDMLGILELHHVIDDQHRSVDFRAFARSFRGRCRFHWKPVTCSRPSSACWKALFSYWPMPLTQKALIPAGTASASRNWLKC